MDDMTIEWAPFELAEGVSEQELLDASATLQLEFLNAQDGFMRRELLHAGDRQWCDLVYWRSAELAERAMRNAAASPVCYRYFHLMAGVEHAEPGGGVQHFRRRRMYASSRSLQGITAE